jgi:hypothetical protein
MTLLGLTVIEELRARGFALQLFDGFTREPQLEGQVDVSIVGQRSPLQKVDSATWVFMDIPAGDYTISVQPGGGGPRKKKRRGAREGRPPGG